MKTIINQLEKIQGKLEEKIDQRTEVFENRSDAWQESEAGEKHEFQTDEFQIALDSLNEAINTLIQL